MSEFSAAVVIPEVEVAEKAVRRQFSAEYKRKILTEADACTREGEIGALLRREGLYSSHLAVWRAAVGGHAGFRRAGGGPSDHWVHGPDALLTETLGLPHYWRAELGLGMCMQYGSPMRNGHAPNENPRADFVEVDCV